jgi:hypothetical protein
MSELDDVVKSVLQSHLVPTTRIGGGAGGATVSVADLLEAVRERTRDEVDLEARLDTAVKRLHGHRMNFADSAGHLWRLRRLFGRSTERPADVYAFPQSAIPPPYDQPF